MTMTFRMLPPPSSPVAGPLVTNAATTTSSPTIGAASVPAWIVPGMAVYDSVNGNPIGIVQSATSTTVTLTANAMRAVTSGETLSFQFPQTTPVNGRSYTWSPGFVVDVADFDASVLGANGWTQVGLSGPTSARPTTNPNTNAPYVAARGVQFYDTTIAKLITFDGQAWRSPVDGTLV